MDGDYYSTIYTWFERCGVISNLRTHLRQNLVNALKNTDMTLNKAKVRPKSAKQYVYDLLVAEYLWSHAYAYTLSVFTSEAPLLIHFHKHISQSQDSTDGCKKGKLATDYIHHTLETLGIQPSGHSGQSIANEYANNDSPLLLSILQCVSDSQNHMGIQQRTESKSRLRSCGVQTDKTGHNFLTDLHGIGSVKKKLMRHKKVHMSRLKEKEEELMKIASVIEQQIIVLDQKLLQAKNTMQVINQQRRKLVQDKKENEHYIHIRKVELSEKENSLIRREKRLQEETDCFNIFENNLRRLQDELCKVQQSLLTKAKDSPAQTYESATQTQLIQNTPIESAVDEEKRELQSLIRQQQSRIEELTLRAVRLSRQLAEAQLIKYSTVDMKRPIRTVLSESSSTDEIIQDAKQRLKRLEEETHLADQSLKNYMTA